GPNQRRSSMNCIRFLCCLILLVLTTSARADDATKEGQLTETLTVKDVQGGFAGFTGTFWTVEPSGKWTSGRVFNQRLGVKPKGGLTKEQLATLGKELARFQLRVLPTKGKPMTNPHVVSIKYGKREATLTIGAGEPLPKAEADSVEGRYSGVVNALKSLLKEKKE